MKKMMSIALILVWLLGSVSCTEEKQKTVSLPTVKIEQVEPGKELATIQYPGYVKSANEANLSFRVSGTIDHLCVAEGSYVRKGQLVAYLDSTDYRIQLDATEAEYKQIKAKAERVIALYEDKGTTPDAYDQARYGLQQITAKYRNHRDQLAYTRLYAPFSGYVQHTFFEAHETVGAGMPVVSLLDEKNTEIEINLSVSDVIRKDHFESYFCTFDVYPDRQFPLEVVSVNRKANSNQLYAMRLRFKSDAPDLRVYPGMVTMVTLQMDLSRYPLLSVSGSSVFMEDGKSYVFVFSPETRKVTRREVRIVHLNQLGKSLIQSPQLKVGDQIVSSGVHSLREGEEVRPLPGKSKTNVGGLL